MIRWTQSLSGALAAMPHVRCHGVPSIASCQEMLLPKMYIRIGSVVRESLKIKTPHRKKDYSSGRSMARSGMSFVMSRMKTRRTLVMTSGSNAAGLCGTTTSARMAVSEVR